MAAVAAMESSLTSLLGPLFPALDSSLLSYLASSAVDGGASSPSWPGKWKSGADALAQFGDMLESYEAVANEKEAKEKCEELFRRMQEKGLVKGAAAAAAKPAAAAAPTPAAPAAAAPAATAAASPAAAAASPSASPAPVASPVAPYVPPAVGSPCMARYSGDGLFYRAVVVSTKSVPVARVLVRFVEYGDLEEVAPSALKDVQPPPAGKGEKDKVAKKAAAEDESDEDSDEDSDDSEDDSASGKAAAAARLLHNPVRIGDLGPTRAAARAAEAAAAAAAAEGVPGRELTHKEQKALRKRELKAERLAREAARAATWNPNVHKSNVVNSALPLYLQSQHLAKKAGTRDIQLEDLSLLAPDNTELLVNTELKLVFGRRYGLIGRNGIGKSTLLRAMSTYSIPRFPTWVKIMHVEQECVAERLSVLEVVINSDLERGMLVREEMELNARLKELEGIAAAAADTTKGGTAVAEPPSPTASVTSSMSATSLSTHATSASAVSSSAAAAAPAASSSSSPSSRYASMDVVACSDRLAVLYERLNELDSATAPARAATILAGLQFTPEMQAMPTAALSGGWRMRVALACALFVAPDLLLLDEPTNHLDFPAVLWLESYLQNYPKTVLIVSHDRSFLNGVITDVVHFTNKKRLESFRGDYQNFLRVKAEKYKNDKRAYEAQQMQMQHLRDFITTFRTEKKSTAQDKKVVQAMMRQKMLDKMERDGEVLENPDAESTDKFSLKFPEPGPLRLSLIAELKNVSFKYPKRVLTSVADGEDASAPSDAVRKARAIGAPLASAAVAAAAASAATDASPNLLEDISVKVELSSRIGILGANGCGKSTLVKVLLGELQPLDGLVWLNANVRIAYFTQHHIDQLNLGLTPVQWLKELFPGTSDVDCRRHLGKYGLMGELALLQIGNLSGGQKSRLAFAIICWREPHMLILDEPTNHLDMDTIDVLIKAVNDFKGAVLIISHDVYFLSGTVREFWSINQRRLKVYDNLDACKKATYKSQGVV